MRKLISRQELAELLDVEPGTLAHWHVRGIGPRVVKIGSRAKYDVSDVERFIESRKRSSSSEELVSVGAA